MKARKKVTGERRVLDRPVLVLSNAGVMCCIAVAEVGGWLLTDCGRELPKALTRRMNDRRHLSLSPEAVRCAFEALVLEKNRLCESCGTVEEFIEIAQGEVARMQAQEAKRDVVEAERLARAALRNEVIQRQFITLEANLATAGFEVQRMATDPHGLHEHLVVQHGGVEFQIAPTEWGL